MKSRSKCKMVLKPNYGLSKNKSQIDREPVPYFHWYCYRWPLTHPWVMYYKTFSYTSEWTLWASMVRKLCPILVILCCILHSPSNSIDPQKNNWFIWLAVSIQFATFLPYLSTVPPGLLGDLHLIRICRLNKFGVVLPFLIVAKGLLPLVHITSEG